MRKKEDIKRPHWVGRSPAEKHCPNFGKLGEIVLIIKKNDERKWCTHCENDSNCNTKHQRSRKTNR